MSQPVESIPRSTSNRPWWSLLFVGLAASFVFFPNLGATLLWDEDEGFYASAAAEMMRERQWLVPGFNGSLFAHKPPMMYWLMMSGYHLFGISEIGARFFSAVFGLMTVLLVFLLGKQLFSQKAGLISSLILATSIFFTVISRSATADLFLTFFVTLAFWSFVRGSDRLTSGQPRNNFSPPPSWSVLSYVAMGLATLTKGPIGFLFPMTSIGLFLMLERSVSISPQPMSPKIHRWKRVLNFFAPSNFLKALWDLRPLTALIVILSVAAPWFVLVNMKTDGVFLKEFFGVHHFQRAVSSMEGHRGTFLYYPISIMVGMYPWTVTTAPTIWLIFKRLNSNEEHATAIKLLVCWVSVYLIVFTMAGTKLPNYVLPAYPAIALLYGFAIESWIRLEPKPQVFWGLSCLGVLVFVGTLLAVAFPGIVFWSADAKTILNRFDAADDVKFFVARMGLIGVPAILCGGLGIWLTWKHKPTAVFWSMFAAAFLTVVCIWNLIVPPLGPLQGTQSLIKRLRQNASYRNQEIGMYQFFRPSAVFYSGRPILRCHDSNQVDAFFEQNPDGLMVAEQEKFDSIFKIANSSYRIVDRQPMFPDKGELVVFVRENAR